MMPGPQTLCSDGLHHPTGAITMARYFRIVVHIFIMLTGVTAVGFSNFWDWNLLHGLFLPIVSAGFFLYLVLFLATGEYRVFKFSD
jgi:hypothetical protein